MPSPSLTLPHSPLVTAFQHSRWIFVKFQLELSPSYNAEIIAKFQQVPQVKLMLGIFQKLLLALIQASQLDHVPQLLQVKTQRYDSHGGWVTNWKQQSPV